jgi:biofilm PGA synthesis N-glycosyltransferase PgaC
MIGDTREKAFGGVRNAWIVYLEFWLYLIRQGLAFIVVVGVVLWTHNTYRSVHASWLVELMKGWSLFSILYWGRTFFLFLYSFIDRHWSLDDPVPESDYWPFVSIIVPAFNEGDCIEDAMTSFCNLNYPNYEVLLVDDGSSDNTLALARKYEGQFGNKTIRVLTKPNGGKWTALNLGFQHSHGELVLCTDADSRLAPNTVRWMVSKMKDPEVGGVAGNVLVRNVESFWTRCQTLEYVQFNDLLRLPMSRTGSVLVVPGPIGLFRRCVMEEIYMRWGQLTGPQKPGVHEGPFEGDTFAEDFDLTVAVLSLGYKVVYEPRAVSHTTVPSTLATLINQRYRWFRGNMQAIRKYLRRAWHMPDMRRPGLIAWLAATYVPDLVLWLPTTIMGQVVMFSLLAGLQPTTWVVLSYSVMCSVMNFLSSTLLLVKYREHQSGFPMAVIPFMEIYYLIVINISLGVSLVDEVRGAKMRW